MYKRQLEEFDSTLYFLDENEVAAVAEQLRLEYTRDARASALSALYDIFELESDRAIRDEIIGVLETLLPNLLNAGEFRAVASVMRDVRSLVQKAPHLSTELRDRLLAFEAKLSEPEIVRQLMVSLDGAAALAGDEDVTEVLRELHPAALGAIVTFLPTLSNAHVREQLEHLRGRAGGNPVGCLLQQLPHVGVAECRQESHDGAEGRGMEFAQHLGHVLVTRQGRRPIQ